MAERPRRRQRNPVELGEIYHVLLDPTQGREQQGQRPVIVVSTSAFNEINGMPIVAPIATRGDFARYAGFTVSLMGAGTEITGAILCNQIRVLDLNARRARRIESAPDFIIQEVLQKITAIFETGEE